MMEYIFTPRPSTRDEDELQAAITAKAAEGFTLFDIVAYNGWFFAVMQREVQPSEEVVTEVVKPTRKRGGNNANTAK